MRAALRRIITRREFDYHVDSVDGSDSRSGRSRAQAFRTLAKVAALSLPAGTRIGLRRGSVWREAFDLTWSGAAGRPILIGAYGSGNRPQVVGSLNVSGTWTSVTGTEYKIATALTATSGFPLWYVANSDGAVTILKSGTAGSLTSNQWAISGGFLNINIGSNPSSTGSVEVPSSSYCIRANGKAYITLQDLEVRYSSNDGISILAGADSITVTRCRCAYNGNDGCNVFSKSTNIIFEDSSCDYNGSLTTFLGDGFSAHVDSTGTIRRSTFSYNAKTGVGNSEQGTWLYEDLVLRGNQSNQLYIVGDAQAPSTAGTHTIKRVTIYDGGPDQGGGVYWFICDPVNGSIINAYHLTIVRGIDSNSFPRGIFAGGTNGTLTVKNVIVSGTFQLSVYKNGTLTFTHDYLCVNGAGAGYSGTAAGAHSITTAPSFVNAANGDFTPASGANIVNAGVAIAGVNDDFYGAAPDIGAVERRAP